MIWLFTGLDVANDNEANNLSTDGASEGTILSLWKGFGVPSKSSLVGVGGSAFLGGGDVGPKVCKCSGCYSAERLGSHFGGLGDGLHCGSAVGSQIHCGLNVDLRPTAVGPMRVLPQLKPLLDSCD